MRTDLSLVFVAGITCLSLGLVSLACAQSATLLPTSPADTTITVDARGYVVVPPATEKAMQRYRSGNRLWVVNTLLGFLVPLAFLFTGFSARMRTLAQKWGKKWFFVIALYMILFTLVNFVIDFPLNYYEEFVREHAYGLSNQTFDKWIGDAFKALGVSLVMGIMILWMPYLLLKKVPKRWWLYTGLGAIPFLIFLLMVSPIWVAPLFNDFGPMKDKALETRILNLADRAGIDGARVFEVNKSVDTETVNAYVTGFAQTKRIVLWDTILRKLGGDEVLFVMGHEMGHYLLKHIRDTIIFISLLIILALWFVHRTSGFLIRRYGRWFGFDRLSDVASLPLLAFLFSLVMFVATPLINSYSRYHEREADRFGLEITHNHYAGAAAFVKLQKENLANPRPGWLYVFWRSSHPPIGERVDFMNSYAPWKTGQPLKYGAKFKP